MSKKKIYCLREFEYLVQSEQPSYLARHGSELTTNAGSFATVPHNGAAISAKAIELLTAFAMKSKSKKGKRDYDKLILVCIEMITANYLTIDVLALANKNVIGLAGLKSTDKPFVRTTKPDMVKNLEYIFSKQAGEMDVKYKFDKLAYSALFFTTTNPQVKITLADDFQVRIALGDTIVDVNITSKVKTTLKKQTKATIIKTVGTLFNPNGLSPLSGPIEIVVAR